MGTRVVCDTSINVSDRHIIFELWPHVAPGRVTLSLHALRVRTHVPTSLVFGSRRATLRRPVKDLVQDGFMDNLPMFRAVPNWLIQWGIQIDPQMQIKWRSTAKLEDDPKPRSPTASIATPLRRQGQQVSLDAFVHNARQSARPGQGALGGADR